MSELPSGAGRISGINAVVLGESLAAEEHDLVYPSAEFSADALVPSPKKV
jgi:acetyl-CoA synthetase